MSKQISISFDIGAALSGNFKVAFSTADKLIGDLGKQVSAFEKNQGLITSFQKMEGRVGQASEKLNAARMNVKNLGTQMRVSETQTAALQRQFNAAQAEATRLSAEYKRSEDAYAAGQKRLRELRPRIDRDHAAMQEFQRLQKESVALSQNTMTLEKRFKAASVGVKKLEKELRPASAKTDALKKQFKTASIEANALQTKLSGQRKELGGLRSQLRDAGIDTKNLASEQARLAEQSQRAASAQRQLQEAQSKLNAAKQKLAWDNIKGDVMTSAALAMTLKAPVTIAMNFEQAMSGVEAVSFAGEAKTPEQKAALEMLRNQALELGRTTQFTAIQAAQAQENLARAGFKSMEIFKAMPHMLDMAAAEGMDLASAASIASGVLRGFEKDASETGYVADVLAKTSAMTKTSIVNLGEAMSYAAPVAHGLGVSVEETAALMGAMANANIDASRAGTSLAGAYARLAKEPKAVEKALSALGVSTRSKSGAMRTLPNIMQDLSKKMEKMGEADRMKHMENIFGQVAAPGMLAVMNAVMSGEHAQFETALKKENVTGTSHEMALAKNDNLAGDLTALGSAWEGLNVAVGNEFIPAARMITSGLTEILNTATGLAKEFPSITKALAWGFGGLAALKIGKTVVGITKTAVSIPFLIKGVSAAQSAAQTALAGAGAAGAAGTTGAAATAGTAAATTATTAGAATAAGTMAKVSAGVSSVGSRLAGMLPRLVGIAGTLLAYDAILKDTKADERTNKVGETLGLKNGFFASEVEWGIAASKLDKNALKQGKWQTVDAGMAAAETASKNSSMDALAALYPELAEFSQKNQKNTEAFKDTLLPQVDVLIEQGKLDVKRDDVITWGQHLLDGLKGSEQAINALPENLRPVLEMLKSDPVIISNFAPTGWGVAFEAPGMEQGLNVAKHAAGGIFTSPHIGLVAEAGPEAIVPLSDRSRGIPLWMAAGEEMGVKFGSGSVTTNNTYTGGTPIINITVNGNGGDDRGLAQKIAQAVRDVLGDMQSYEERVDFA